jgi:hypothetical protein
MLDTPKINKNSGIPIGDRPENHVGIMGNNEQPWLPIEAIDFLYLNLNKKSIGFEYGSGSSTFWFSKFTDSIYSIENSSNWYFEISKKIEENSIENIFYFHRDCKMLPIWDIDLENTKEYVEYSSSILDFDIKFDYILIDGVARSLCIQNSINKLNSGGYLIIDNAERPGYWESMEKIPKDWEILEFSNSVDKTLIYRKGY